jgi:hypothetical protein
LVINGSKSAFFDSKRSISISSALFFRNPNIRIKIWNASAGLPKSFGPDDFYLNEHGPDSVAKFLRISGNFSRFAVLRILKGQSRSASPAARDRTDGPIGGFRQAGAFD